MTSGSSGAEPPDIPGGEDVATGVAQRRLFEVLLGDLAAGFINLEPEQVDQAIEERSIRLCRMVDDLWKQH